MAQLTVTGIRRLTAPGRYGDGDGLYLVVRPSGTRAWVLRVVGPDGKRRDIGLGGYPLVSLAEARKEAIERRKQARAGLTPQVARGRASMTFREAAEKYLAANGHGWTGKTAASFASVMEAYVYPHLGHMALSSIRRADVLSVLSPIWSEKPAQARKLRHRLSAVFSWAVAWEHINGNPCDSLDAGLPKTRKTAAHFRSLHHSQAREAMATIGNGTMARLALSFTILTAARSGEVRGMTWDEVDLAGRTWTVPASKMKNGKEHRVPLSPQAVSILEEAHPMRDASGLVFPSLMKPGRALSDMALLKVLRDTGLADRTTVHGFRASFRDWAAENGADWAVAEMALSHTIGDATAQAYMRSDLFERRRELMDAWADYLTDPAN